VNAPDARLLLQMLTDVQQKLHGSHAILNNAQKKMKFHGRTEGDFHHAMMELLESIERINRMRCGLVSDITDGAKSECA